ncbi:MAG: efflux RND transporter periplasmic adaptor subunit, partial [Planctomycetota bacterium]
MSTKRTRSPSKPPRSIPWWALVSIAAVALASGWVGMRWGTQIAAGVHSLLVRTQTIVGLTKTSEPIDQQKDSADEPGGYYTCGMHPWVILPHEGDCPICHMKLTPLDPDKFTGEVVIDPVVVQNIGVRVEEVTQGPLVRTIRTVGNVDYDETRVRDVNTKFEGWIEKLYVDYVGAPVNEGEPLFDIYSPALYQAQEEYLLAVRAQRQRSLNNPGGTAIDLVESARTKLELFDVTDEQIDQLERTGKPSRTLKVLSPHTGVVIAKHANEGMNVTPGMQVFRIADLSRVWVHVTVYESQIPYVSVGQKAVMTLPYIPGQEFAGRVVYIYPYVDTATREVQVRLEFENQGGLLKPGMFATVELQSELRKSAVLAPRSAVISTGERNVAFVSLGQGKFEPRTVELGVETGDGLVEVLSGLTPGELVVTSGQFLLDSESRVREALAKMIRGNLASEQQAQVAVSNQTELASLPEALQHALAEALTAYFAIGDQLASDSTQSLAEPARALAKALDAAIGTPIPDDEHFWHRHTEAATARGAALELVSLNAIDDVREKYAILSVAMDTLIRATGVPPAINDPVESLHCPMFREGQGGAIWLQPAGAVRNPFFGSTMLKCFDKREGLPPAGSRNQPAPT